MYTLWMIAIICAACLTLQAQHVETFELKNPFNLLAGTFTIGPKGVTMMDGHTYHIRIQEPDMSKVIPMPGANLKHLENPQHLQREPIRLYTFPTTPTPPSKDR